MEKTLLRPTQHTHDRHLEVNEKDEHTDLGKLVDEMKPFLDLASQQLVKPDNEVVIDLIRKASH